MASPRPRTRGHAAPKPTVDELLASRERTNRASAEFLKIDLETALTFVDSSRLTHDVFRKKRNCQAARKAYDTVVRLISKVDLAAHDRLLVKQRLERLKTELEELGETF